MRGESPAERKARARRIVRRLGRAYPDAHCALHHRDAFELLVATILSAQCTDKMVNQVTPDLFARFPTAAGLADADPAELEPALRAIVVERSFSSAEPPPYEDGSRASRIAGAACACPAAPRSPRRSLPSSQSRHSVMIS